MSGPSTPQDAVRRKTWMPGSSTGMTAVVISVDRPDQVLDLLRVRTELFRELVEIGIGDLLEAGLVDIGDDLHPHLLKLGRRSLLELEAALGLLAADLAPRSLDPL